MAAGNQYLFALHKSLLIIIALLMCNPFWYLILTGVYAFLVLPIWLAWKTNWKEKLFWTLVPIGIPTFFYALLLTIYWFYSLD